MFDGFFVPTCYSFCPVGACDVTDILCINGDNIESIAGQVAADRTDRVPPPVSTATGGLMPGIDLNDIAALQEMEDLDYARRFK
jgi:hypothetical protein